LEVGEFVTKEWFAGQLGLNMHREGTEFTFLDLLAGPALRQRHPDLEHLGVVGRSNNCRKANLVSDRIGCPGPVRLVRIEVLLGEMIGAKSAAGGEGEQEKRTRQPISHGTEFLLFSEPAHSGAPPAHAPTPELSLYRDSRQPRSSPSNR